MNVANSNPEAERHRHRHHDGGFEARVPHQRRQPEEGGERRKQDGPEALDARLPHREREAGRIDLPLVRRAPARLPRQPAEVGVQTPRSVDEVDHDPGRCAPRPPR